MQLSPTVTRWLALALGVIYLVCVVTISNQVIPQSWKNVAGLVLFALATANHSALWPPSLPPPPAPPAATPLVPPLPVMMLTMMVGWAFLACGAPQLSPADRVEIVDTNVAIYRCQEAGREAGTYAAYDACMRDAGFRKDAGQ